MHISVFLGTILVICAMHGTRGVENVTSTPSIGTKIEIPQGMLEGKQQSARNGRTFAAFLGIPYGKATRFEEAVLAEGWNGTRDATKFGDACLQDDPFVARKILGAEDCLFLNVYTPNPGNESKGSLPVMVFIHGGGWQFGSGDMADGKYFMSEDVVIVFINYRLGLFGFLKTATGANLGMKDQILALKWVQQNIVYFGGDPNVVTIFGESAGGASTSFLLLSPLSKGLFHRAISQSGVANSPFALVSDPARELKKLGILMDCPTSNQEYLIQCLKKIDGHYMLQRISTATKISMTLNKTKEFRAEDIPRFLLSVDADATGSVFLPDTPLNLLRKGDFAKIPWISGVNTVEGVFFPGSQELRNVSQKSWNSKDATSLNFDEDNCNDLNTIREYYIGGDNKTDAVQVSANVTDLCSDRFFNHPAKVASALHARHAPAYLYHFSLKGTHSFVGNLNPSDADGLKRPAHADELQYQFRFDTFFPEIKADSKYAPFSEFFVKLWVSFAKDGTVNPEKLSTTASAWTPVRNTTNVNDDIEWYELNTESKMVKESVFFNSRLSFWNDLLGIK